MLRVATIQTNTGSSNKVMNGSAKSCQRRGAQNNATSNTTDSRICKSRRRADNGSSASDSDRNDRAGSLLHKHRIRGATKINSRGAKVTIPIKSPTHHPSAFLNNGDPAGNNPAASSK